MPSLIVPIAVQLPVFILGTSFFFDLSSFPPLLTNIFGERFLLQPEDEPMLGPVLVGGASIFNAYMGSSFWRSQTKGVTATVNSAADVEVKSEGAVDRAVKGLTDPAPGTLLTVFTALGFIRGALCLSLPGVRPTLSTLAELCASLYPSPYLTFLVLTLQTIHIFWFATTFQTILENAFFKVLELRRERRGWGSRSPLLTMDPPALAQTGIQLTSQPPLHGQPTPLIRKQLDRILVAERGGLFARLVFDIRARFGRSSPLLLAEEDRRHSVIDGKVWNVYSAPVGAAASDRLEQPRLVTKNTQRPLALRDVPTQKKGRR